MIGREIEDFTSGFRCYSREFLSKILPHLHSQTYEIQIETIRQAKIRNMKISEVPITFESRKKGKSKLTLREIIVLFKILLKILIER